MEHIPTIESDIQKVCRIARELGIGIEEAAITCDAFHLAFSDDRMRRAIFDVIDELDRKAASKGEPPGLIINYAVQLGMDGIGVERYADEIPAGEIAELIPSDRARIFLKINDNFPTQQFLGPLIVDRPGWHSNTFDPDSPDLETQEVLSCSEPGRAVICLGPIRLKFNERFPFVSTKGSRPNRFGAASQSGSAGLPFPYHFSSVAARLSPVTCHLSPAASGLSPPTPVGEPWTLRFERCSPAYCNNVETCVSHLVL